MAGYFKDVLVPWTRQPQGAAHLDWSNPLTEGLLVAGIPLPGNANLVTGVPFKKLIQGTGAGGGRGVRSVLGQPTIVGAYQSGANGSAVEATGVTYSGGEFSFLSFRSTDTQGNYEASVGDGAAGNGWALILGGNANSPRFVANATTVEQTSYFSTTARRQGALLHIFRSASLDTWSQGVPGAVVSTAHSITPGASSQSFVYGGVTSSAGAFTSGAGTSGLVLYWERALTATEAQQITDNPWQIFAPVVRRVWVPVSAGGGTTITATPGNAVADGAAAGVVRNIAATPGNAVADGALAGVNRVIGATPGNGLADGTAAAVLRNVSTNPGNATADGTPATITTSGTVTISCTPGNAAADGALAAITRTIAASPGDAVANGSIAALLRVIASGPGNAIANGVLATISAVSTSFVANERTLRLSAEQRTLQLAAETRRASIEAEDRTLTA